MFIVWNPHEFSRLYNLHPWYWNALIWSHLLCGVFNAFSAANAIHNFPIFHSTRYPLLLGGQRQYGMRSLSGTSTHDQHWECLLATKSIGQHKRQQCPLSLQLAWHFPAIKRWQHWETSSKLTTFICRPTLDANYFTSLSISCGSWAPLKPKLAVFLAWTLSLITHTLPACKQTWYMIFIAAQIAQVAQPVNLHTRWMNFASKGLHFLWLYFFNNKNQS